MEVLILSFLSGVSLTIGGAYLTYLFQRKQERQKDKEKLRFEIYMDLLNIRSTYSGIIIAEIHNEKASSDIKTQLRHQTWKICDKLRQIDDIEFQDEILDVLFSEKFLTAQDRNAKFSQIIEGFHKIVNPRFTRKVKEIDLENRKIWAEKDFSNCNAPGTP